MASPDPYRVLGVAPGCDQDAITAAYRTLSQQMHPDRTLSLPEAERRRATEQMVAINQAYALIGTADARRRFDQQLRSRVATSTPTGDGAPTQHREGGGALWRRPIVLGAAFMLLVGPLAGYRVVQALTTTQPVATLPTFGDEDLIATGTVPDSSVALTPPPPPSTVPPVSAAPASAAPASAAPATAAPSTTPPFSAPPPTAAALTLPRIEPLRTTTTFATAPVPGCWFVQVAATPDPNAGVEWARPAAQIESATLRMYFVSFEEWPDLPFGTVLAGTIAGSQADGQALLSLVQQLGIADSVVRPMPAEVCRALVPFRR